MVTMEEEKDGFPVFYADSARAWRDWLERNHASQSSVWLVIFKKDSQVPSLSVNEAIDEALCFGWVDSKPNKRDDKSYYLYFSQRKPKSNWSKVNKDKVEYLIKLGKMTSSGWKMIELAKATGTWDALNEVDSLLEPEDLAKALESNPTAKGYWGKFPPSARRGILEWILNAKTAATRTKRITETVLLAEKNFRANSYPKPKL
ncbi:YdeI/OmpD-associated family protein [Algoriphagus taiwanensis]|uniref:YdeI/OmpD-associated family protein n=1 Tax=Algoriphagus taiwanensis TaxID=1445656 RepID=A0ABQ6Q4I6_9BACT|nr:YdeI/OmpD-associated family protein [Algoriphagus taiwanensis]